MSLPQHMGRKNLAFIVKDSCTVKVFEGNLEPKIGEIYVAMLSELLYTPKSGS